MSAAKIHHHWPLRPVQPPGRGVDLCQGFVSGPLIAGGAGSEGGFALSFPRLRNDCVPYSSLDDVGRSVINTKHQNSTKIIKL
jgi:hypothetical protein